MPSLPLELEREIVEIAIRTNHKDATVKLNLSSVAHRFHLWVDEIFYESLTIDARKTSASSLRLFPTLKPAGFFATTVKALSLLLLSDDQMAGILAVCTGVQELAIYTIGPCQLSIFARLPLRRLCITTFVPAPAPSSPIASAPTWFSTLTHLDLGHVGPPDAKKALSSDIPTRLPRLTHLALDVSTGTPAAAKRSCARSGCPGLQVLVLFAERKDIRAPKYQKLYAFDHRIVLREHVLNNIEDWEAPLLGVSDFWTHAESIVAERVRLAQPEPPSNRARKETS
ncbi:hypothetical protein B0H16DRAFT_1887915 [Mycena metata]|uniref:Uncharacterized protein n=1 Tax=Mycena metata TaxID=1033252 RepID=A0AAD7ITZ6_9AGAR|nr:hypothetical protein B0H16DRAFT_1887915 [Mycena metata]